MILDGQRRTPCLPLTYSSVCFRLVAVLNFVVTSLSHSALQSSRFLLLFLGRRHLLQFPAHVTRPR